LTPSASSRRSDGGLTEKEETMSRTNSRLAVAAILAALSVPAYASDAYDPTQPAVERPAPAIAVRAGQGDELQGLVASDPTWPAATANASPAIALSPEASRVDVEPPAEWAPEAHYAVELAPAQASPERVAKAR
jgi:hypothetical protein